MTRPNFNFREKSRETVDSLYKDMERRMDFAPLGSCPLDVTSAFLRLCLAQSCGKCVPCRVGIDRMISVIEKMLDGKGTEADLALLEKTARTVYDSADCAIGFEAAGFVLKGLSVFCEDYLSHIEKGRCASDFKAVPCVSECPANVDVPGYIALAANGRYADAVRLIRKDNPFPSVCGLICEHPCESHCRRALVDAPVNIRAIKRFAIDHAGKVPAPEKAPATGKKIAVIGGGPSGLSAAYYLSLMGHSVTVFERKKQLGGMLRYGIPCYRLPDNYLDYDIEAILSLGVEVKTGVDIGKDISFDELRKNFDSVYISIGAQGDKKLNIPGEESRGVVSAVHFLRGIDEGEKPDFTGKNVVIIGGGNVAMDAARTSIRLGAKSVTCAYRRRIEDMTALSEEIESAASEGCEMLPLMAPSRIESASSENVTAAVFRPQIIGEYINGRPSVGDSGAPEIAVPADIVIIAIGQDIESEHFSENGIPAEKNMLITDESGAVSGMDGVFAGGDCVFGPATVIKAVAAGKTAAANISEYLGVHVPITSGVEIPPASYKFVPPCGRINPKERPAKERKMNFELGEKGFSEEEAHRECSRCLRCDHFGFGKFKGGREFQW